MDNGTSLEVPGDELEQINQDSPERHPSPSPPPVLKGDSTETDPEPAQNNPLDPEQQVADEDSNSDVDTVEVQTPEVPPTAAVVVENKITDTDNTDDQTDPNITDTASDIRPPDGAPADTLPKQVEEKPQEQTPRPCFPSESPRLHPTKSVPTVSKTDTPGNATQSPGGVVAETPVVEATDVREVGEGAQDPRQTLEGQTPDEVANVATPDLKDEQKEEATPTEQIHIPEKVVKDELTDGSDIAEQTITVESKEDGQTEEDEKEKSVVIKAPPDKDMPSFDEWKKKMLAEQAEQEKTKQQEVQSSQSGTNGQAKVKTSKNRVNYAAATCGCKVLSTNTEAKNQGSILTENKDQYMINPCHAKKWFIVELCEPMQIQTLEMGNLELFSSVPESFIVQISDRYPAKDWKALGTFHARDERTIQSFSVQDEHMFAKYLKIEMLAHYGSEHYCPLSIIRVFGTTMEEDENEEDDVIMGGHNAEQEANGNVEEDEQANLFTSATNTVISLVKTVLSPGQKEENMEEVVALQGSKGNTSGVNTTDPIDKNQPCSPESSNDTSRSGDADSSSGVPAPCQPTGDSTPLSEQLHKCQYCQAGPLTCCPFDRYTLCGYHRTLRFIYRTCCVKPITAEKPIVAITSSPVIEPPVSIHTEIEQPAPTRTPLVETSTSSKELKRTDADIASLQSSTVETSTLSTPEVSPSPTEKSELTPLPRLPAQDTSASISISVEPSIGHVDLPIASEPTPTTDFPLATEDQTDSQIIISSPLTDSTLSTSQPAPSTGSLCDRQDVLEKQKNKAACSVDRSVADEIRPSASEDVVMTTEVIDDVPEPNQGDTKSVIDEDKGDMNAQENKAAEETQVDNTAADAKPSEPATGTPQVNATTNGMRDIYAEPHSNNEAEVDLDTVPPPGDSELLYQKSGKKETTYMRLKNRIKALELNLNLSSRYLEELSQRYKRQMEEMYTSLNKTITKLTKTTVSAERRDEEQQADISVLHDEIRTLKQLVYSLQEDNHSIHTQVVERHLFLMLIEVIVFILIMSFCLRRQRQPPDVKSKAVSVQGVTSPHVKSKPSESRRRRRRNSIDSTPVRAKSSTILLEKRSRDDIDVIKPDDPRQITSKRSSHKPDSQKGSCPSDLTIIEPSLPIFTGHTQPKLPDIPKKKKKKKTQSKNALQAHAASQMTNQRLESQTSNSKLVQSAGVLFATHNGHQEDGSNACPQGGALVSDQAFSHPAKRLPSGGKNSSRRSLEQSFNGHDLIKSCSWNGVEKHPSQVSNINGISAENIGSLEAVMTPKNTSSFATQNGNVSNNIRDGLVINSDPCCRDSTRKARWKWWSPRLALQ